MELGIGGRVAIVCGASQGMGRAIAEGLLREGARVAICARDSQNLDRTAAELGAIGGADKVAPVAGDLVLASTIENLVATTLSRWGRIDIVLNNLGGPPPGLTSGFTDQQWLSSLEQNFLSVVRMCRLVVPDMRKRRWGRIINLLAVSVKQVEEHLTLSSTARTAVVAYSKGLSDEVAADGITVNNVLPGSIATDRLQWVTELQGRARGETPQQAMATRISRIPAGRLGKPEEMADLVCFLASERAAFINGVSIPLDGGQLRTVS